MTKIVYDTNEYNIVYIDPTIAVAGDGTSAAQALVDFPSALTDYTCYLVRRTDDTYLVDLPRSINIGLTHIILLGMPRSSENFYDQLDDEVKTLWGSDSYPYAQICCNVNSENNNINDLTVFYENNIRTLLCENCCFFRDDRGIRAYRYRSSIFYFNSDNRLRNLLFKNCKFTYTQYDIDNQDFLDNNSDVPNNTSKYPQCKATAYLYAYNANTLLFEKCIINHVCSHSSYSNSTYNWGTQFWREAIVLAYGAHNFIIKDSQLNHFQRQYNEYNGMGESIYCGINLQANESDNNYNRFSNNIIFNNFTVNLIYGTTCTNMRYEEVVSLRAGEISLQNIRINFKNMKGYNTKSYNFSEDIDAGYGVFYVQARSKLVVDGVQADLTTNPNVQVNMFPLLWLIPSYCSPGNPGSYVKNIDIRFPKNPDRWYDNYARWIIDLEANNSFFRNRDNEPNWYNIYYDSQGTDMFVLTNPYKTFVAEDIYVYAPQAYNGIYLYHTALKTKNLETSVYLNSAALEIDTLKHFRKDTPGLTLANNSYAKCNNYITDLDEFIGKEQVSCSSMSSCYIVNSNVMPYDEYSPLGVNEINRQSQFVCLNVIEPGQYFSRNTHTFCKAWSVTREGSTSQASLKLYNNTYTTRRSYPLVIGASPYKGFEITPATLGKKLLVCYCARSLFEGSELEHAGDVFWIEVLCKNTLEDQTRTDYYSSFGKMFTDDNSSWSGTADLTPFRIEVPIEIKDLTQKVEVKLHYNWYSPAGFVYVDPDIRLIDVVE